MSYTIEVYLNDQKAEKHLGIYALYVMFYPQLVAGPIERPQNLLHQFHQKHKFEYDDVVSGLRLMMWGMFKKTVIADRLALVTDPVYNNPHDYPGITLAIATVFFAFQMFCDFSGYSDIAIGAARIMGFKLMLNFDRPFKSKSLTEFWRRWHISLSSWLFDYIFNPIVFSFRYWGKAGMVVGLLVTFLVSGIWHGAGWKFILCGFLQGLGLVYEYLTKKQRKIMFGKLPQWLNDRLSIIFTFCYMSFTWIFFRANTLDDAFYVLGKIPSAATDCVEVIHKGISYIHLPLSNYKMILCVAVICIMELVHRMQGKAGFHSVFKTRPRYIKWGVYYFFCVYDLIHGCVPKQAIYLLPVLNGIMIKKFILSLLLFCLVPLPFLFLLAYVVDKGLQQSRYTYYSEWNDIFGGKINADVVIMGDSKAWVQFSPMILDTVLHVNSYNLGMDGSVFPMQYERLKIYLKHNRKPRYILQEVGTYTFAAFDIIPGTQQLLPYLSDPDVWKIIKAHNRTFGLADRYFPMYKYNNEFVLIKEGLFSYFGKGAKAVKYKGYGPQDKVWDSSFHNFTANAKPLPIPIDSSSIDSFREYVNFCKANDIKLILVYPPFYVVAAKYLTNYKNILSFYNEFSSEHNIPFYNYCADTLCNNRVNFYNSQHLNRAGAEKFTTELANDLKKDIPPILAGK